jgi:hypothetical protein
VLIIWSIKRHKDPDLHIECDSPIDELTPSLAGLTLATAIPGNSVEVLENGRYFDILIGAIDDPTYPPYVALRDAGRLLDARYRGTRPSEVSNTAVLRSGERTRKAKPRGEAGSCRPPCIG